MKIAAGLIEADEGEIFRHPGATIRYLPQEPDLTGYDTVIDYVRDGLAPGDEDYRAIYLLEALGLTGEESTQNLSGGEVKRAALARTLAPEPDILMLDEPTNHLDLPAIEWLEGELKSYSGALILISHDRRFLENLSRITIWLDRGKARRLDKGFAHFEAWRDEVLTAEEDEQHKLDRKIVREEHWLRYGVTARRKRNVKRLSDLQSLKQKRRDFLGPQSHVTLAASEAERSGKRVIEADHISKSYDDRPIVTEFSTRITRGDRIGLVGPNGAGKTTLLNMLIGELSPDEGTVKLGTNLELASLDQKRAALKPGWSLKDALTQGSGDHVEVNGQNRHVMSYMKDFLFLPEQAGTPVEVLSGGEKARVMLARALALPSNLLVLDEPTNDLDLETLDLLQGLIADYEGTVILVSHDRDFLDRTVNAIIVSEGQGRWQEYAGGYSDMLTQRGKGVEAVASTSDPASKPASSGQTKTQKSPSPSSAKMTYKDKYALETLPEEIDQLDHTIAQLENELANPDLFTKDPDRFAKASQALSQAQADRDAKEEHWLELEMLREELESG